MLDDKITVADIPDIIFLVAECSDNLGSFKLTYNELPEILEELINYILDKFNVIPDEQEDSFRRMVSMVVKLVMLKPRVKRACTTLLDKLNIFKKCTK